VFGFYEVKVEKRKWHGVDVHLLYGHHTGTPEELVWRAVLYGTLDGKIEVVEVIESPSKDAVVRQGRRGAFALAERLAAERNRRRR
jgi:hypothetical protein